jgi:hypothetical protein
VRNWLQHHLHFPQPASHRTPEKQLGKKLLYRLARGSGLSKQFLPRFSRQSDRYRLAHIAIKRRSISYVKAQLRAFSVLLGELFA